jgi:hypothetical protein
MSTPFTLGTPIPAILWSSLEDVLGTTLRLFAKDIAKTLGQPEAPLLHALQAEKICPYIFDEADAKDIDMRCPVLCQKPDAPRFVQACCNPIAWNSTSNRCIEHVSCKLPIVPASLPILRRLEYEPPLWVSEDSTVYDANGSAVGGYTEGILTLFCVDDE